MKTYETQSNRNNQKNKIEDRRLRRSLLQKVTSSNVALRTVFTLIMVVCVIVTLFIDKFYLFITIYVIKTMAYNEITNAIKFQKKRRLDVIQSWYFMIVIDYYLIGGNLMNIYADKIPVQLYNNHLFVSFNLYIAGIIIFILNLKGKAMRTQFGHFALSHITMIFMSLVSSFFIINLNNGKLWFLFPALLVASNDIFAYIFGKFFGKTPLIKLSPKKTWEGFAGGLFSTLVLGHVLCLLKTKYTFCPDKFDMNLLYTNHYKILRLSIKITTLAVHMTVFALFAGLIAPFGGFFASGFKRAFKIKDFGESIPGHGGIVDRLDCQFLMGIFVNVYYRTFVSGKIFTPEKVCNIAIKNLSINEVKELVYMLNNFITNNS
ncbi:hypothetical protein EDEG_01913 [Edhazardia aedis USNM 41457]|uniref:Phosphatidate cytidylyltransferase n=1 Tax=Edhazardia aedis (strain USNM 41457) TaxID=1003232 RepID=J9D8D8_EDHAE|nr:hypothetical protein EDEG_01913 [Edhazardia aedis USNM 41457]|eukprot:EJW03784.1 hypothetical protein EDEG_01913 [Edhazardia aedis USNM 41457]